MKMSSKIKSRHKSKHKKQSLLKLVLNKTPLMADQVMANPRSVSAIQMMKISVKDLIVYLDSFIHSFDCTNLKPLSATLRQWYSLDETAIQLMVRMSESRLAHEVVLKDRCMAWVKTCASNPELNQNEIVGQTVQLLDGFIRDNPVFGFIPPVEYSSSSSEEQNQ